MKPIVQQLPLQPNSSFSVSTFRVPDFEKEWHQHTAFELNLFTEGNGLALIGNHSSKFEPGDIYFLGANIPHKFQQIGKIQISALIVHFYDSCLGNDFFNLPECRLIKQLLEKSAYGLKIAGNSRYQLQPLIKSLEIATNGNRIILLLQCLQIMASTKDYVIISLKEAQELNGKDKDCIDQIFKFTNTTFQESVSLSQIAAMTCKSVPSFCHYFKRRTQKTYINFLNEVRVNYACNQLLETNKSVTEIGYESGYNTVTNFHRQFLRLKKITPLQYRKLNANI
jgi:AraC-like DNA-binding protein